MKNNPNLWQIPYDKYKPLFKEYQSTLETSDSTILRHGISEKIGKLIMMIVAMETFDNKNVNELENGYRITF